VKQVIQSFKTGELKVAEVPSPNLRRQGVLVRTAASLVSAGTERMVVDFAEKNMLQKARARPDLVRQVVDKAQREGVVTTIDAVRNRLDQPLPLGYSSAGIVVAVGEEADEFRVGDRVACAGGGYAGHAELAYIPRNLAVPLADNVSFEAGAFGTLGAIALQGVRQADVVLGCNVAVIGLGLLGQLTVQLLKAAGCRVFGIDLNPARVELARTLGADRASINETALADGLAMTAGRGFDAVLITADTSSSEPVALAGELARDRAIVVAVGAVGMEIPRKVYYEKELDFRLSRSYGPGRYDAEYEEKGQDYPYAYVRWTEGRNIEAFLGLIAEGKLDVGPLISHRFAIDEAERAYDVITGKAGGPFLGVVLTYDVERELPRRVALAGPNGDGAKAAAVPGAVRLGLLGAGNFANATLLPAMKEIAGLELVGIASGSGMTARHAGDRFGFAYCATDDAELLADEKITWLAIATRHDLHARQAIAAMRAGKDVFVEKPLALSREELVEVAWAQRETGRRLMVGFNRRFAPMAEELQRFLAGHRRPLVATYRANAGNIPANHWTQDPRIGGGRIVGEAVHFIDLLQFLTGAPVTEVYAVAATDARGAIEDEAVLTLTFGDGSVGTVVYAAGGDKAFSKERIEAIGDGRVAVLDDFRSLELVHNGKRTRRTERLRPDKGHRGEWLALVKSARAGADAPISFDQIVTTHLTAYAALESLRERRPVAVDATAFWQDVQG
jgi:predicted dehydrogenase/threonine dehydrogenase-like Zn-dependent dehydrogenase